MRQRMLRYLAEMERARFLLPHSLEIPPSRHEQVRLWIDGVELEGVTSIDFSDKGRRR
jgi:hypothetical protein